jgi:hypothetical protein
VKEHQIKRIVLFKKMDQSPVASNNSDKEKVNGVPDECQDQQHEQDACAENGNQNNNNNNDNNNDNSTTGNNENEGNAAVSIKTRIKWMIFLQE